MSTVHELWHFKIGRDDEEDFDDIKQSPQRIGIYSTKTNALMAIQRLTKWPEFANWSDGFRIYGCDVEVDNWEDGFVTEYYPEEN